MDIQDEFKEWAKVKGIESNGIEIKRLPGRGLGIIADKELKAGDTILTVPIDVLRTIETVPKDISKHVGEISIHSLLAIDMAINTHTANKIWGDVLPSVEDFDEAIPMMWDPSLQALLPPAALSLMKKQQSKILNDWTTASTVFPALSYNQFLYSWNVINSRTFYYTSPDTAAEDIPDPDDCLALVPFADFFNHADAGCEVTFSPLGYKVCTDRDISAGQEIYISYGNHSNDFLLAEYGFILDENKWDEIPLDDYILPMFSEKQKRDLKKAGYLGNYILDQNTVCYRSQVSLRLLCMPLKNWLLIVKNGVTEGDAFQKAVSDVFMKILNTSLETVTQRLDELKALESGRPSQRETLSRRWKQISLLLTSALHRTESGELKP